jgi:hypothetical protein
MVRRTAALFLTLGLAPLAAALAGTGTDAVPFMKVDTGARAAGMAGAFAAVADDASAVFHNPAGLVLLERSEAMFSHSEWLEGIRNECVSYAHVTGNDWAFGAGASMLFSGSMTKYNRSGASAGSFTENEGFASAAAANRLGENMAAGFALKGIYQKLDQESAAAYAADAGLLYHDYAWRFSLGVENIGSKLKLYREEFDLPAGYKAAAAWRAYEPLWVTAQVTQRPSSGFSASVGTEYGFLVREKDMVYVRAGYLAGPGADAGSGLALGLGLGNSKFKLDYAFTPFGDLGNAHRVSFSLRFGEDRETLRSRDAGSGPYKKRYKAKGETWKEQKRELDKQQRQKKEENRRRENPYFTW